MPPCLICSLLALLAAPAASLQVASSANLSVGCEPFYLWPSARGRVGTYSHAPFIGVPEVSSKLSWKWQHPAGRFNTVTLGTLLDDLANVYLTADDGIRKFDKDGKLLWTYTPKTKARIPTSPSLMMGNIYGSSTDGRIFRLSMQTGKQMWQTKVSTAIAEDVGSVSAYGDMIVVASDMKDGANRMVRCLRGRDGSKVWSFTPDAPVWNFQANFVHSHIPRKQFVLFQDIEGRVYKVGLQYGKLAWKSGGVPGTATDGAALLGENNVVYSVSLNGNKFTNVSTDTSGNVTAHALNGTRLWSQSVPRPPSALPAVGKLFPGTNSGFSVVVPVGRQCARGQSDVYAFEAATGQPQWKWEGPVNTADSCAGDQEGYATRTSLGIRQACMPSSWGSPSIDSAGVVYIGNHNGRFYSVKDLNGDGRIDDASEVSSFDAGAAFSHPGTALAPGMVAVASCDQLLVFKGTNTM